MIRGEVMIGKVLGGRYEIIEKVGDGGMGIVYKAKCKLLNRYVAVKVLRNEFVSDEQFVKKFRRESQAVASLSHPNIVGIYDVGVEEGEEHDIHYIVMEYIDGKTLEEIIQEKGKLSAEETVYYSTQIAEALEHAHKNNIIHRDIKPHNIMVTKDNRIKVTDFGIARAATSSTLTTTSSVIGSVHYFSPEQARGGYTDERSDIYSLGIVMYEMILGTVPFKGESPVSIALKHVQEPIIPLREIDSSIPRNLEAIINKCLKKDSAERYQNANELLNDLRKVNYSSGKNEIFKDDDIGDSATQIIPVIDDENLEDINEEEQTGKDKSPDNMGNKKNKKHVVLGVLLAFLLVTGMFMAISKARGLFAKEIEVPKLLGLQEDVAKEKVEKLGLEFNVKDRQYSSEYNKGEIMSQSAKPGEKVKKGYPIDVIVSEGKKLVKVPNLAGKTLEETGKILKDAGLKEGSVNYRHSDSVPANSVIEQDPKPDTEVPEGATVNIVVSKGPEKILTTMPNLIGRNIKDAKNAIIASGLAVGEVITEPSEEYPENLVTWQNYKAGTQLEKNTVVTLRVSSGEPEREEEPEPKDPDREVRVIFKFRLPDYEDEKVQVRVDRCQDGVRETVYEKEHDANGKEMRVKLKGKPGAYIELYFDDEREDVQQISEDSSFIDFLGNNYLGGNHKTQKHKKMLGGL